MSQLLLRKAEEFVEQAWQTVDDERLSPCEATDIVNSVVDLLVQANVNLSTVTLEDMKRLLTDALWSRREMLAFLR